MKYSYKYLVNINSSYNETIKSEKKEKTTVIN